LMALDMEGFAVSTGAACSSGSPEPSPVLLAMGLTRAEAQCSLRVGVGWGTTDSDIDRFVLVLKKVVDRLRGLKGYQVGQVKRPEESSCLT
jgi:cysteine desulfurase